MDLTGTGLGYGSQAYGAAGVYQQSVTPPPETITIAGAAGYGVTAYGQPIIWSPVDEPTPPDPVVVDRPTPFPHHSDRAPHYPRFRTREEIRADRDALWDIEEPAEKVVEKVARKVIARATEAQRNQVDAQVLAPAFDPLAWLAAHQEQQRKILEGDLRRKRIDYGIQYWMLLKLEIERQYMQDREDEAVVMMLMEM